MSKDRKDANSPRIQIIQKLYSNLLNPSEIIIYSKHQYKKFIKDVVSGTIERNELINETIEKHLMDDLDNKRTDKLLKIIIQASVFEFLYKPNSPKNVIINEYIRTAEYFLEKAQIKYLNAILDKISKKLRK